MIKEAIILAGGLGTRLQSVVSDVPKCMAPVAGKPFLHYVIDFLQKGQTQHFIFSVGYMHELIEEYLSKSYSHLNYTISLENEPLGTGGAIKLACEKSLEKNVLICNGDTLYQIDISAISKLHVETNAACTLSLKPMHYFDRYGVVELNKDHSIKSFKEKQYYTSGLINGGFYTLNVQSFLTEKLAEKFSFEKDYLEKNIKNKSNEKPKMYGIVQDAYFIDIGVPEDYARAQNELCND
ncbi:MAG: nucleotidyltransferase family protein [Ginsengibacter sp.]